MAAPPSDRRHDGAGAFRFFATAAKGTEPALRDELRELRLRRVRADRGGVHFEGDLFEGARACLWSRIAVRILLELATFPAGSEPALYDGARAIDWTRWIDGSRTMAVRATCRSSQLTHSQYVAQKTKDAVVDMLRERRGARPSVDRTDPDVGIAVHLARDVATIYLDVGGGSLHERGWRVRSGPAPLRETLAAAVLRLAGWDRTQPLLDPMCGAGTLAIEAAAWSSRMAPGLGRERFGLERWASFDATTRQRLRDLRGAAREGIERRPPAVRARDVDAEAVAHARENAHRAGVRLEVERGDVRDLSADDPAAFLVTNPPYGERIAATSGLYAGMARAFERNAHRSVALLAGSPEIGRAMRRPASRWWILFNGPIECRLLVWDGTHPDRADDGPAHPRDSADRAPPDP